MLDNSSFLNAYSADISHLRPEQKETIDVVAKSLIDIPAYQLSAMTHSEAPWKDARTGLDETQNCSNIISKEVMQEYYAENW